MPAWCATCAPLIADLAKNYDAQWPFSAHHDGESISHRHVLSRLLRTRDGGWDYFARGVFPRSDPHRAGAVLGEYDGLCRALGLTLLRLVYYRAQLIDDLTHHARGVTFLTTVAGTCILGNQFAVLTPLMPVAVGLWFTGWRYGLCCSTPFFTAVTIREPKPSLETGINGAWLLVVVSTESLCVLGTLVAPALAVTELVLFVAFAMYLVGAMLYMLFITLILYRWMFFSMSAETLMPTYWINMGALAITTLAGSRLLWWQTPGLCCTS